MAIENKMDLGQVIRKSIEDGVKSEIEREWKVQEKIIMEHLERRKTEMIAGLTLRLMKQINMQAMGEQIIITSK